MNIQQTDIKASKAKEFFYSKDFQGLYLYDWLLNGAPELKNNRDAYDFSRTAPSSIFMTSHLHLTLNKMVEKQNCMVEGKYKKARLYIFETDNFYVAATCETGDRGSGWYVVAKDNLEKKTPHYTDDLLKSPIEHTKELGQFMRLMCWNILNNNSQEREEVSSYYEEFITNLQKDFGPFSNSKKLKF